MRIPSVFVLSYLSLTAAGAAQTVKTIVSNGPTAARYDMVILGDGYRAVEQTKFDQDCQRFTTALLQKEPYKAYAKFYNIHTVFRASQESGADHPDRTPPIVKNTVYNASYNTGGTPRCLYIRNTGQALRDAALAPANEGRVLVFVNDTRYGGCGGSFAVSYTGSLLAEVQIHEIGHSIGRLADEYGGNAGPYTGGEPGQVNATKSSTGAKWSRWLGSNGIGAFEGCRYYNRGLWRPWSNCLMRSLNRPLCSVCGENIILETYKKVTVIGSPVPASTTVRLATSGQQRFSATVGVPAAANPLVTWKVDGQTKATGPASFTLQGSTLSVGRHTVELAVQDRTVRVRRDTAGLLLSKRVWQVDVTPPQAPDLTLTQLAPSVTTVPAGGTLSIRTVVRNAGPVAAAAHRLEHFISTDATITAADPFLGGLVQGVLAASASRNTNRSAVRLPSYLAAGTYWIGAVVDRTNAVAELNENNNTRAVQITVQRAACTPRLEYRDPLLYPNDRADLSISSAFPIRRPTVSAPCHPGAFYLIAWGCSGTVPGTQLGSVRVPLNLDLCTEVGLVLASNKTFFTGFLGNLDKAGIGNGTASLFPRPPYRRDLPGHLAAVLLDPARTRFLAATNAVGFTLVR